MNHRGMTLLETVLALTITAVISIAGARWIAVASSAESRVSENEVWMRSAHAVLGLIARDLLTGDMDETRINVSTDEIRLATRSGGPVSHVYRCAESQLVRISIDGDTHMDVLLGGVMAFECLAFEDTLRVKITGADGQAVAREYRMP